MPTEKKTHLIAHLDQDWQRQIENVRQAASRLWATSAHSHDVDHGPDHADRVVALLDGLTEVLMERPEYALASAEVYISLPPLPPSASLRTGSDTLHPSASLRAGSDTLERITNNEWRMGE